MNCPRIFLERKLSKNLKINLNNVLCFIKWLIDILEKSENGPQMIRNDIFKRYVTKGKCNRNVYLKCQKNDIDCQKKKIDWLKKKIFRRGYTYVSLAEYDNQVMIKN